MSREEIERLYPSEKVSKDSTLTTSYTGLREKAACQVYIYGLADPRDHVIKYVGKTSMELGARLDWHLREPTSYDMDRWLWSMKMDEVRPEIAVLEICHRDKWEESERAWIARLRRAGSLLNVEDGGESPQRVDLKAAR